MSREALAIAGGQPVRRELPEPPPRLTPEELRGIMESGLLRQPEWSRSGDDWPLPHVDRLEQEWAAAHRTGHAVAVSSGTAGLTLILRSLGMPRGDEVLIPAYGCPAVDMAVLAAGLTPVHVDVDPRTYCLSPTAAASAVTARTTAIIAVHFAGQPAGLATLARVADRNGLALIEDACLAPGAEYDGKPVGGWGRAAVFSLGVRKPISAGEGGVLLTNDPSLAETARRLRSFGADPASGDIARASRNHRLTELQAAVALPQFRRLDADTRSRTEAAARLRQGLTSIQLLQPLARDEHVSRDARAQFWMRYGEEAAGAPRAWFVEAVQAEGVPLFEGWSRPNYTLQVYTSQRAAEWLRRNESGRPPKFYEQTCCPHAERAAFGEALLFDLPLLTAGPEVIDDAVTALLKVAAAL